MDTNKKIFNVAIVGCGTIAPNHIYSLLLCDCIRIVALCDINRERAEKCKQAFDLSAKIYTDYTEMIDSEVIDAVHIATPHYLHADMTVAALRKGINVFLEKPMCISEDEITHLLEEERKSSAKVCVCFQNRFTSAVIKALEIAEKDGGAMTAYFSVFWKRDKEYYTQSGWRGSYTTEGGGVMINQAIHSLDLLTCFLGIPKSVTATKSNHHLQGVIEVEDTCEGLINFESGATANFYATTAASGKDFTTVCVSTKNHVIEIKLPNLVVDGEYVECDKEILPIGKECYGDGHIKIIRMFYDSLLADTTVPVSLESAQHAVKILLSAYKSNNRETII